MTQQPFDETPLAGDTTDGNPFAVPTPAAAPSIDLTGTTPEAEWTIDDILTRARRPERRARICLRADLDANHAELVRELATIVGPDGALLDPEDDEVSLTEESRTARAKRLNAELDGVRAEMAANMWRPLVRAMPSDEFAVFHETHYPKTEGAPLADYQNRLVAACLVAQPAFTPEHVAQLRKTLSFHAINTLVRTATEVNTRSGVDLPF
ncbi:hypothetical protein [Nocardioides bruguierae]|uniref:hypothetical protein n=1 Tax=Nocardioides bruguierae TaxID=2945102 RepID=UPI002020F68C|nr:hypothetical protein [Nocardioides bruguierae]MCL8026310.1 hypothetical protein [Nocardioides bruguierae]